MKEIGNISNKYLCLFLLRPIWLIKTGYICILVIVTKVYKRINSYKFIKFKNLTKLLSNAIKRLNTNNITRNCVDYEIYRYWNIKNSFKRAQVDWVVDVYVQDKLLNPRLILTLIYLATRMAYPDRCCMQNAAAFGVFCISEPHVYIRTTGADSFIF